MDMMDRCDVKELIGLIVLSILATAVIVVTIIVVLQAFKYAECQSYSTETGALTEFSPVSGCYVMVEDFQVVPVDSLVSFGRPLTESER